MKYENAVLEAIHSRRSIRSFLDKPVERRLIEEVIAAGNSAATPGNAQPFRFVVIQDAEALDELRRTAKPFLVNKMRTVAEKGGYSRLMPGPYAGSRGWTADTLEDLADQTAADDDPAFYYAPVIVALVTNRPSGVECMAVGQDMMIAAQSLGLGSVCVTSPNLAFANPRGEEILGLADGEGLFGCILLGYPAVAPESPPKQPPQVKWV